MQNLDNFYRFVKTIRKKSYAEIILCLILLILIIMYYCIDLFHILPFIYRLSSFWYLMHVLLLSFITFNILINFVAVIYVDSSILDRYITLPNYSSKGRYINST